MSEDIVPTLLRNILNDFESMIEKDDQLQEVLNKTNVNASFEDVFAIAGRVGEYASNSLKKNYTHDVLPDGILYWNIAYRTLIPLMQIAHELILDIAETVQRNEDKAMNIGIKPIRPEFNKERIEAVLNKITYLSRSEEVRENG